MAFAVFKSIFLYKVFIRGSAEQEMDLTVSVWFSTGFLDLPASPKEFCVRRRVPYARMIMN